jgi:putative oxidoreductase
MASVIHLADRVLPEARRGTLRELGVLALRLGFGLTLALVHGWDKLITFGEKAGRFPDPLGVGHAASLGLVVFAEFFCGLGIATGLLTRLAAIPVVIQMAVALLFTHNHDEWRVKEPAFVYLLAMVAILLLGSGRFSLDGLIRRAATSGPSTEGGAAGTQRRRALASGARPRAEPFRATTRPLCYGEEEEVHHAASPHLARTHAGRARSRGVLCRGRVGARVPRPSGGCARPDPGRAPGGSPRDEL